jgi:hypothetical protein
MPLGGRIDRGAPNVKKYLVVIGASVAVLAGCGSSANDSQTASRNAPSIDLVAQGEAQRLASASASAAPTVAPATSAPVAPLPDSTPPAAAPTLVATKSAAPVAPVAPQATCTATVSNPTASDGTQTVTVHSSVPGVIVMNAHYKTTTSTYGFAATDSAGNGAVSFSVGSPTKGYTVVVDVIVGHMAQCSTSFTPS